MTRRIGATRFLLGAVGVAAVGVASGLAITSSQGRLAIGSQLAELSGAHAGAQATFGASIAVSDNTAVVGTSAPFWDAGVYVFNNVANRWHEVATLRSPGAPGRSFAYGVAVSGKAIVAGDSAAGGYSDGEFIGGAYVFTKAARGWRETARLRGAGSSAGDGFGSKLAISANTIVVGALSAGGPGGFGTIYIFTRSGAGWHQSAEFSDPGGLGTSLALSGGVVVAGAPAARGAGRVFVFTSSSGGRWHQTAVLKGSGLAPPSEFGLLPVDGFGSSVAFDGHTLVAGTTNDRDAYVFQRTGNTWKQAAKLKIPPAGQTSVGVSGATILVGDGSADQAYLFTKSSSGWHRVAELKGHDTISNDFFGWSVAVSGTTCFVGAPTAKSGRVYLFAC